MGLKVWLPLNGDLHNQGTSNYTISVFRGTETYDNNGKIGKCFYAHGTNALKILNILPDIYNYSAYSLCAWCYVEAQNTSHSGSGIISGGNWNNQLLNLAMSNWSTDHYTKLRISGSNWNRTYNYNFYKNTWYHIVVCDDGTHTYGYVNGVLIGDTAASFLPTSIEGTDICIGGATYYAGMQFFGKINDVRIYDHCLSAAEVREISHGLVLHYKLDDMTSTTVEDSSGYGHSGIRAGTISAYTDSPRYSQCMNLSATSSRINCGRGGMMKDSITINFWANLPTVPSEISDRTAIVSCSESGGFRVQIGNDSHLHSIIYINSAYAVIDGETVLQPNTWYMMTLVYDRINGKLYEYLNGEKEAEVDVGSTSNIGYHSNNVVWIGVEARSATSYYSALAEKVSDFRIYCTALNADAIRQLYEVGAKVDNQQNIHTYEIKETQLGKELVDWNFTTGYTNHTTLWNNFDENGEVTLTGNSHLGSAYIKINPTGKKYYFDADISVDANNQIYIGFQRYDAAKTSRSNDATMYTINVKPTTALVHKHYHGIYDATVGTSNFGFFDANTPVDTISIRVLNDWSNANNRKLTIHSLSLREVSILDNSKINKQGQIISDLFIESTNARIQKNSLIESTEFIEI